MAFLRFPAKTGAKKDGTPTTQAPRAIPRAVPKPATRSAPGPTTVIEGPKQRMAGLGTVRVGRQYTILGATFAVLFAAAAFIVFKDNREATYGTIYVSTSAQMRMLTQRIAKAAQTGLIGSPEAFKQLQQSRDEFIAALKLLTQGGQAGDVFLPPTSDAPNPQLDALTKEWEKTDRSTQLVLAQSKNLIGLATAVRLNNTNHPLLLDLAEQVQALKLQSQAPAREVSLSGQLVMLTQRLARNANAMLGADVIDPEVAFLMGKDTTTFRELLQGLMKGGDVLRVTAARDPEQQAKLAELDKAYQEFQGAVASILGNLQSLVNAKQAGRKVVDDSEPLLAASQKLADAYEQELGERTTNFIVLGFLILAAIAVISLIVLVYLGDTRRRAEAAEYQRAETERTNQSNQDAILRLMNEMGNLAEGDLTVKATVTEEITGAIADSVNFTIDELRGLIGRINAAAAQVTTATESAQKTSAQRLGAQHGEDDDRHVDERLSVGERGAAIGCRRAEGHPGGAELDLGHERDPRADPGDLQAHQAPGRILAGDRRDRGADLGYYRADERPRPERRDPGGFGGRGRTRLHGGGGRSPAARGALGRGDQANRRDREDHSDGHAGRGHGHGEKHPGRGRRGAAVGRRGPGARGDRNRVAALGAIDRGHNDDNSATGDLRERGGDEHAGHPQHHAADHRGYQAHRSVDRPARRTGQGAEGFGVWLQDCVERKNRVCSNDCARRIRRRAALLGQRRDRPRHSARPGGAARVRRKQR